MIQHDEQAAPFRTGQPAVYDVLLKRLDGGIELWARYEKWPQGPTLLDLEVRGAKPPSLLDSVNLLIAHGLLELSRYRHELVTTYAADDALQAALEGDTP